MLTTRDALGEAREIEQLLDLTLPLVDELHRRLEEAELEEEARMQELVGELHGAVDKALAFGGGRSTRGSARQHGGGREQRGSGWSGGDRRCGWHGGDRRARGGVQRGG
eukprot:SAG11_NODE_17440_length_518_cov_2.823389_1_plen_108_part_10